MGNTMEGSYELPIVKTQLCLYWRFALYGVKSQEGCVMRFPGNALRRVKTSFGPPVFLGTTLGVRSFLGWRERCFLGKTMIL